MLPKNLLPPLPEIPEKLGMVQLVELFSNESVVQHIRFLGTQAVAAMKDHTTPADFRERLKSSEDGRSLFRLLCALGPERVVDNLLTSAGGHSPAAVRSWVDGFFREAKHV